MSIFEMAERASWKNFPKVIRNDDLGTLAKLPGYSAAKQGDTNVALNLVLTSLHAETLNEISLVIGTHQPKVLPVLSIEETGYNKLPLALAEIISHSLDIEAEIDIIQVNKVLRTNANADHRLTFNPRFSGKITENQTYFIVDDTLTMGGTIASLRGYVENRGGIAIGAMVLTAHKDALEIAIKPDMIQNIESKHGHAMNQFFEETFGYGIDKLTQGEAGHVRAAASVDNLRSRILEARRKASQ